MKQKGSSGGQKKALSGAKNHIGVYAGQYFDSESSLHYNYHRYYSPTTGRYLRADPIGLPGGVNLFSYVLNNPIKYTDSLGLEVPLEDGLWPPMPNGTCGSGWNEPLVPDNPFGFNFSNCCQEHDACYGNCDYTQEQCDNNFETCLRNACAGEGPGRPMRISVCQTWAERYASAVRNLGEDAFDRAQEHCDCNN